MLRQMLFAAAFLPVAVPAFAVDIVQPADLGRAFFDARPITTTDTKGRSSTLVFAPGGTLTRTTATGKESAGTWRLSDDGFCMQVGKAKRESCYVVLKRDDGTVSALRASQPFRWER